MQTRQVENRKDGLAFLELVQPCLTKMEAEMKGLVQTGDRFLDSMALHLLQGGGKRLRPAFIFLSGMACGGDMDRLVPVAAAAELIHMATLIHDDMVDSATVRRGVPTINAKWGTRAAILLGDYLFARAFSVLASTGDNRVVKSMADVVHTLCMGEIEQMGQLFDEDQDEARYLERINKKTAYFFAECCLLGGILSDAPPEQAQALRDFGYGIGMGFQIIDDILDLVSSPERLGKPVGSDLRGGVITLPVIHAMKSKLAGKRISRLVSSGTMGDKEVAEVRSLVMSSGGLDYAYHVTEKYTNLAYEALRKLPDSPSRQALFGLADYLVRREY